MRQAYPRARSLVLEKETDCAFPSGGNRKASPRMDCLTRSSVPWKKIFGSFSKHGEDLVPVLVAGRRERKLLHLGGRGGRFRFVIHGRISPGLGLSLRGVSGFWEAFPFLFIKAGCLTGPGGLPVDGNAASTAWLASGGRNRACGPIFFRDRLHRPTGRGLLRGVPGLALLRSLCKRDAAELAHSPALRPRKRRRASRFFRSAETARSAPKLWVCRESLDVGRLDQVGWRVGVDDNELPGTFQAGEVIVKVRSQMRLLDLDFVAGQFAVPAPQGFSIGQQGRVQHDRTRGGANPARGSRSIAPR